jgi:hypothetical protein
MPEMLTVEGIDNDADELIHGCPRAELPPEVTFTQAQIAAGEVVCPCGLVRTVSALWFPMALMSWHLSFEITVNTLPVMETSAGLALPGGGSAVITNTLLQTTDADPDDPPSDLIYTIVQFPSNGILNLGSTFSQTDVDNNLLTYTHTDTDADMFTFVVSDGYDVIGTYIPYHTGWKP